jgi:hypothetical protein
VGQPDNADPLKQVKQDYLAWQSRKELADGLRELVRARLTDKDIKDGNRFLTKNIDQEIKKLLEATPDLESWEATERQRLLAAFTASGELLVVLTQIRDVAKQRMAIQQRKEVGKATKPTLGPPASQRSIVGDPIGGLIVQAKLEMELAAEMAKWRGEMMSKASAAFKAGSIGTNMADLETALQQSWTQASEKLQAIYDRCVPAIAADGFVRQFRVDGLIQDATRTEVREAAALSLTETKDPNRIREVIYDVTDAYGKKRRGSVAVYLGSKGEWLPSRENELRGGFYELRLADEGE